MQVQKSWEELRRLLNAPYSSGSWFWLPGRELGLAWWIGPFRRGGHRSYAVILGDLSPSRPVAHGYSRSTTTYDGVWHPSHPKGGHPSSCRLEEPGRIKIGVPLSFRQDLLNDDTHMCDEPDIQVVELVRRGS
jgi:hypothetical protein